MAMRSEFVKVLVHSSLNFSKKTKIKRLFELTSKSTVNSSKLFPPNQLRSRRLRTSLEEKLKLWSRVPLSRQRVE